MMKSRSSRSERDVVREKHSINGRFAGVFYTTESGKRLYLAHRKPKEIDRRRNAWLMSARLLEKCIEEGVTAFGVVCRKDRLRMVWATDPRDFFDSPAAFPAFADGMRLRGLPLNAFRIDPAKSAAVIERAIRIAR